MLSTTERRQAKAWCRSWHNMFVHQRKRMNRAWSAWTNNIGARRRKWTPRKQGKSKRGSQWMHNGNRVIHKRSSTATRVAAMMFVWQALVMTTTKETAQQAKASFDSDSVPIRVDNHASYCISGFKQDFVSKLVPTTMRIKGYHAANKRATNNQDSNAAQPGTPGRMTRDNGSPLTSQEQSTIQKELSGF